MSAGKDKLLCIGNEAVLQYTIREEEPTELKLQKQYR